MKTLKEASSRHTLQDAFGAMIDMAFCAHAKLTERDTERCDALEAQYMRQVGRWPKDDVRNVFPKAVAQLMQCYAEEPHKDHLGVLAAEEGLLSSSMGQFFTPDSVCALMAKMNVGDIKAQLKAKRRKFITVAEPAAGAGAMVLAVATEIRRQGFDPVTTMWVEATELNYLSYQMCFLAFTFAGISARVVHGNTLSNEIFDTSLTPPTVMFLARNGNPWAKPMPKPRVRTQRKQPPIRVRKNAK
jgi:hypothetical protein